MAKKKKKEEKKPYIERQSKDKVIVNGNLFKVSVENDYGETDCKVSLWEAPPGIMFQYFVVRGKNALSELIKDLTALQSATVGMFEEKEQDSG